jgi:ABC-type cobalamin/Fe3+-siderophores transport system ATPase subunit
MTFDTKINTFSVRSLYPDPEILFLGFFSAAGLIMYCWLAKADAATFLVLLIASTFWLLALRAFGGGVRAWQLRYFGIIEKENQNKVEENVLPTRSGNIQYNLPAGFGEWSELIIPSGKATFILGNPGYFRSKVLEWLMAMDVDEGGLLLVGEKEVGKRERPSLWRNVSGIWDDKALGKSFIEQVEDPRVNTYSVEWQDIFNKIAGQHQPEVKQVEDQYALRHSDQKHWAYLLANSLQIEPDIFVLNKSFDDIDSFNRLILLENIVAVRKGKTTIIATAGKESAMVADWIIYIQGNNILDQGIPSDVIQRQGLL